MNEFYIKHEGRTYLIDWSLGHRGAILIAGIVNAAGVRFCPTERPEVVATAKVAIREAVGGRKEAV